MKLFVLECTVQRSATSQQFLQHSPPVTPTDISPVTFIFPGNLHCAPSFFKTNHNNKMCHDSF